MSVCHRLGKFAALGCAIAAISTTARADNPAATINVNANANRHAISPLIYGANWADQSMQSQTNGLAAGLGTNWVTVSSSAQTNQVTVPVNQADVTVFRLMRP